LRQICRRCWTPSQNTTSRMHLKNGRSAKNGAYYAEENYFKGDGGQ
jgi:hypothetical protein